MNNVSLALSSFRRHMGRTIFTVLSVATAFAIFSLLAAIHAGMTGQLEYTRAQRLITINMMMNGGTLPVSYADRIAALPGVSAASYSKQFTAYYRRPANTVAVLAFPPNVVKVYPELKFSNDAERRAFLADRQGAIAGPVLARRMGWKVGDTIPLEGGPLQKNGRTTWTYHLDAIYRTDLPEGYQSRLITNYDYYNEGIVDPKLKDRVYQFDTLIADPRAIAGASHAIDELFADSSPQTLTFSEQQAAQSGLREFGDVGAIITYVGAAVFFSMLLITGNTVANSVRERWGEFAMMRALGFGRMRLMRLVLVEAFVLTGTGAVLGLAAGWEICRLLTPYITGLLQAFALTLTAFGAAAALAIAFAFAAGAGPGWRASTLSVAEALRGR